jgi:phage gp29-like protein
VVAALASRPQVRNTALLDQYGQPMSVARRMVAAPNPRGMQTYSSHPEVGLTVELLSSIHRSAELGAPTRQCDLYDGLMERHAEMRGMFAERNEDVSGCDFSVVPPPDRDDKPSRVAAQALQEYLQYSVALDMPSPSMRPSTCFRTYLEHMLTAIPYGYACTNLVWDYLDKLLVPTRFEPIAQRRFGAPAGDRANEIWLIDGSKGAFELIELQAGCWSIMTYHHRNPYAAGLMRSCAWWVMFALLSFKQWQIFADMFGLPLAIGYYEEGAGKASRDALEDAVRTIGQDGFAILSQLTELVIKETARGGDSSTVYPLIMAAADKQITKLITGGTLNTDVSSTGAGSYNAATVHESRSYKMKRRDATRVEDAFVEGISKPFIVWNGFDKAAPPRLKLKILRDELSRAQTAQIIGEAMDLSKSQLQEEFNFRPPAGPDDVVRFQPTPTPDPGRARGGA